MNSVLEKDFQSPIGFWGGAQQGPNGLSERIRFGDGSVVSEWFEVSQAPLSNTLRRASSLRHPPFKCSKPSSSTVCGTADDPTPARSAATLGAAGGCRRRAPPVPSSAAQFKIGKRRADGRLGRLHPEDRHAVPERTLREFRRCGGVPSHSGRCPRRLRVTGLGSRCHRQSTGRSDHRDHVD